MLFAFVVVVSLLLAVVVSESSPFTRQHERRIHPVLSPPRDILHHSLPSRFFLIEINPNVSPRAVRSIILYPIPGPERIFTGETLISTLLPVVGLVVLLAVVLLVVVLLVVVLLVVVLLAVVLLAVVLLVVVLLAVVSAFVSPLTGLHRESFTHPVLPSSRET